MKVAPGHNLLITRWCARAPRVALIGACVLLAAAGLRSALAPSPRIDPSRAVERSDDTAAEALAEAFVREYLTWDGEDRADRLARFGGAVDPPRAAAQARQSVSWTSVANIEPRGSRRVVTVTAHTNRGAYNVAVTVRLAGRGQLALTGAPAIVGALPIDTGLRQPAEREVDDHSLAAVIRRSLTNYLARDRTDLLADLDGHAVVVLPDQPLRLRDVGAITWAERSRRAAVELRAATQAGVELSLRYELAVLRRGGRWLVRSIHTDPTRR